MTAFHTNDEGKTLPCESPDNCPFGAYDSAEESQKAFEKKMSDSSVPVVSKTKKSRQAELNEVAKNSVVPDELEDAVQNGGIRVLSNLVKNANVTSDQLRVIVNRTDDRAVIREAKKHPNFPVSELTDKEIYSMPATRRARILNDDSLDDDTVQRLSEVIDISAAFYNHNNMISAKKINELASRMNPFVYDRVHDHPKFDLRSVVEELSEEKLQTIAMSATNPDHLHVVYSEAVKRKDFNDIAKIVAGNNHASESTLNNIALNGMDGTTALRVHTHPNASDWAKTEAGKNPLIRETVERNEKIDKLLKTDVLDGIFKKSFTDEKATIYEFDTEKMKKLGLNDLSAASRIVSMKAKDYLFGMTYNPNTGALAGRKS